MSEPLKILQKWEDMVEYGYTALRHYPKSEKFALAAETRTVMWEIEANLLQANGLHSKQARSRKIQDADMALSRLKVMIRAGYRLKFLAPQKYKHWSWRTTELGKMIGGWIAATKG